MPLCIIDSTTKKDAAAANGTSTIPQQRPITKCARHRLPLLPPLPPSELQATHSVSKQHINQAQHICTTQIEGETKADAIAYISRRNQHIPTLLSR